MKINLFRFSIEEYKNIVSHFLKWTFLSTLSGIVVGASISLFLVSLEFVTETRMANPWLLYLLPFAGAFVSYLYFKLGKDCGKGNNLIIERMNNGQGYIPFRMAPLVFFGTIMTHLFGGSAGREGTGVQIGASIASKLGRILILNDTDLKIIVISGMSSGFGVVFGTPMAGTVFGLEVTRTGLMLYEAMIPALIASFIGDYMSVLFNVDHTSYFMGPALSGNGVWLQVIICAIIFGVMSKFFSETTHFLKAAFTLKIKNTSIKSFIGGLIIIGLTFTVGTKMYLGLSLDLLSNAFTGPVSPFAFINKSIFTSLTLATGFQGGEVTPLFVIGASLGNFLATLFELPIPFLAGLGMIGVFCGATKTPIASFIMGIELFGGDHMQYLFAVCLISFVFAGKSGIYTSQENGMGNRI